VTAALVAGAAAAKEPRRAYTPAGTAQAKAIAIKLSDLPSGWKPDSTGGGKGGGVTCPGFDPDQSDLTSIGHAETAFARRDGLSSVLSVVGVFKTAGQAQTSWNRVVAPGILTCLARLFEQGASSSSAKTTVVASGPFALRLSAPRRAAYRIVAVVATQGQRVRAYVDLILQGGGRADTVVLVTSVLNPPAAAFERQLAAVVAERLRG
jgi:hypothetical protein